MKTVLAIESSCDETAVAVLRGTTNKCEVLASEISSQIALHREYGGVVPELASRNHSLDLRPTLEKALEAAKVDLKSIDVFAATGGPGLASSLLIGHTAAKGMAVAAGKPFLSINHMEGHLLSPFLESERGIVENVALIVSGGHTMLMYCSEFSKYQLLGKTLDDAAGEAFDKVAKMLGLPYPGGPEIEKRAKQGDPTRFSYPRSMKNKGLDFSFSGLKTAVLYSLTELAPESGVINECDLPDVCASFQQAVLDVLVIKTLRAVRQTGVSCVSVSGGVSCNQALCNALKSACKKEGINFSTCSRHLSTDNAAMIGFVALHRYLAGERDDLSLDVNPNLTLL